MRGKAGLVIGLAAGYVLGTRAGRKRYEQIRAGAEKVWQLEPVQRQVVKAKSFAGSTAMKIPALAWKGVAKAAGAATRSSAAPAGGPRPADAERAADD